MKILVIDDEKLIRMVIHDFLGLKGSSVDMAEDGIIGLAMAQGGGYDAILVDLNMPRMDGYEFIAKFRESGDETPIIVLSGAGYAQDAIKAMHQGAWDFITKPLPDMGTLLHAIERNVERARLIRENRSYQHNLEVLVDQRTDELVESRRQILACLGKASEFRDNETGKHVLRVGEISALLAKALGLDRERVETIRQAAPMHDVGKIGIPDSILLKPGTLVAGEWEKMKEHCRIGYHILTPSDQAQAEESGESGPNSLDQGMGLLAMARRIALRHHERWNGRGYPDGLSGEGIPMEARIVSLADVLDALMSERPYKRAMAEEDAMAIIVSESGAQFDPAVVDGFKSNSRKVSDILRSLKD